jgi:pilus assembly protein CpaB
VLATRLSGGNSKSNLSGALTPGMRAISVRSSDVAGVGGFVLPGDRVDVMLTRTTGGEHPVTVTQVLAENALVLGVDQSNEIETDKAVVAKTITLEVTPDQAQTLTLAQAVGTVSLSLRQIADGGPLGRRATTVADLGGFGAPNVLVRKLVKSAPKPGPKPGTIEVQVTRGVEASGYTVGVAY